MLELIRATNYDFMGKRKIAYVLTSAIAVIGLIAIFAIGPHYSIDFTGGTVLELRFSKPIAVDQLRHELDAMGYVGSEIQEIGKNTGDVMIRTQSAEAGHALDYGKIKNGIEQKFGVTVEKLSQELVGPKVGGELKSKALWAVFWALGLILLYVGVRYDFKFAVGGVVALFHDLFIVFGLSVLFHKELSLTTLAAFLTLAGYSINDTIVVFDRIREQMKGFKRDNLADIINASINQTLSRTVITALTVFLSTLALYLIGGTVIHDFAFVMLVGVISGTYSSIFVASAMVLDWTRLTHKKATAVAADAGGKTAKVTKLPRPGAKTA